MIGGISHPVNPIRLDPTISSSIKELTTGTTPSPTRNVTTQDNIKISKKVPTQLPPKKIRKWKKKKDGTYGWVTSLAKPGNLNFNLKASISLAKGHQLSITRNKDENESNLEEDNAGSAVGGRLDRGGASGD